MAKKTSKRKTLNILDKNKKHSQFDYTEIFRHIRTNIEFSTVDKDIKSICITSSQAGEAKTTLSINLAYIFATKYNRVLLVSCEEIAKIVPSTAFPTGMASDIIPTGAQSIIMKATTAFS